MGLTGLAFVFLVVLIGTVGSWPFGGTRIPVPVTNEETLARLGVAPGIDDTGSKPARPPDVLSTPPLAEPAPPEPLTLDDTETLTEI